MHDKNADMCDSIPCHKLSLSRSPLSTSRVTYYMESPYLWAD